MYYYLQSPELVISLSCCLKDFGKLYSASEGSVLHVPRLFVSLFTFLNNIVLLESYIICDSIHMSSIYLMQDGSSNLEIRISSLRFTIWIASKNNVSKILRKFIIINMRNIIFSKSHKWWWKFNISYLVLDLIGKLQKFIYN